MPNSIILNGHFYKKYKSKNSSFNSDTFLCAEKTAVDLLKNQTTSDHPGMLLGKVQSGKTRTFISVLAIMFDNQFDIAIVLSKNSKALIKQTEKRLNREFNGFVEEGELEIYDILHAPKKIGKFELKSKLLFVAKKQGDNLDRLKKLFDENPLMQSKRTIIIDDEADNASIGYAKKDGEIEANKISLKIQELRKCIPKSSFLQVTATPYSLYLQPADAPVINSIKFEPTRPAFTHLVPVPAEYVGGNDYFGDLFLSESETVEKLIHVEVIHKEFDYLKKPDGRSFGLENVLKTGKIVGYRKAIVDFIVGGGIQQIISRGLGKREKDCRYSFLLHSEAGKTAHDWQYKLTDKLINKLKDLSLESVSDFQGLVKESYDGFSCSLNIQGVICPDLNDVISHISKALQEDCITIIKVNSDDDVAGLLDDTGQLKLRTPYNIFLGGQVLDRGITLAGLIGFYYGRRPQKFQQDTVMQHSRMYGYRRQDLAVTRFYTSRPIRYAMTQMEEFDASLRNAIESGGDRSVQFIRKAQDGSIVPCNPNKILITNTQALRPHKRILPIGFQTGHATGRNGIEEIIKAVDEEITSLCGFEADPALIQLNKAIDLFTRIKPTLHFEEEEVPMFDWDGAIAALVHLSQQHSDPAERGKVFLWAARNRNSARKASEGSHATYIETPDSNRTEGKIAKKFAINHPILFLLRQNGAKENGWRDTPFYWPVLRAQAHTPIAIYASETID